MSRENEKQEGKGGKWQIEKDYWNYVENNQGDPIKVLYANDLPTSKFGSGFGRKG